MLQNEQYKLKSKTFCELVWRRRRQAPPPERCSQTCTCVWLLKASMSVVLSFEMRETSWSHSCV